MQETPEVKDAGSASGSERSPGVQNDNPLQYSCLETSMDRGAQWATIHEVTKSWTRLSTAHPNNTGLIKNTQLFYQTFKEELLTILLKLWIQIFKTIFSLAGRIKKTHCMRVVLKILQFSLRFYSQSSKRHGYNGCSGECLFLIMSV